MKSQNTVRTKITCVHCCSKKINANILKQRPAAVCKQKQSQHNRQGPHSLSKPLLSASRPCSRSLKDCGDTRHTHLNHRLVNVVYVAKWAITKKNVDARTRDMKSTLLDIKPRATNSATGLYAALALIFKWCSSNEITSLIN